MTKILPYPWQVTTGLTGDTIPDLLLQYDDAKQRAKYAASKGVWGVDDAWNRKACELAEQLVEKFRNEPLTFTCRDCGLTQKVSKE